MHERPDGLPRNRLNISQPSFGSPDHGSTSLFLNRLPLETRLRIYEYVLGSQKVIHLVREYKKVVQSKERYYRQLRVPFEFEDSLVRFDRMELDLLRTCRQIYREAIDIVYSCNTFDLEDPGVLVYLNDYCLRPQRIASIRSLQLKWQIHDDPLSDPPPIYAGSGYYHTPFDAATWQRFCYLIATRMSLTRLTLRLQHMGAPEGLRKDAPWVQALGQVKGIRDLKFHLQQWGVPTGGEQLEPHIQRRGRPVYEDQLRLLEEMIKQSMRAPNQSVDRDS